MQTLHSAAPVEEEFLVYETSNRSSKLSLWHSLEVKKQIRCLSFPIFFCSLETTTAISN